MSSPANKLALDAGWNRDMLAIELQALLNLDFAVELTGFSLAELDVVLDHAAAARPDARDEADDRVPAMQDRAVSVLGDVWLLGRHRQVCGEAQRSAVLAALMDGDVAVVLFTKPP